MERIKQKVALIPLAFGDIYKDKGTGVIRKTSHGQVDGSIYRLRAGLAQIRHDLHKEPDTIIQTAGYAKRSPGSPVEEREVALGEQLHRYMDEHMPGLSKHFISTPNSWSTKNEIHTGIEILERRYGRGTPITLYVSSNLGHMPRIFLYLKMYKPKNWTLKLVLAHHNFGVKALVVEAFKTARDVKYFSKVLYKFIRKKYR